MLKEFGWGSWLKVDVGDKSKSCYKFEAINTFETEAGTRTVAQWRKTCTFDGDLMHNKNKREKYMLSLTMADWVNENNNYWSYKEIKDCFLSGKTYYMSPENGSQEVEASTNDYTKVSVKS